MKLTYLGTAAAEGFPAIFCNCEFCKEARKLKGKNIRTRSQSIINDDMLIDFPADSYMHFLQQGIEADEIKYLLITHSHMDHFYYPEFKMRSWPFAHDMRSENLEIFCGKGTFELINNQGVPKNITVTEIKPFETVSVGDYKVTGLPARHMPGDGALIYIIQGDKTVLYAHDTGYFYDEVLEFIKENNFKFDMVSFDCTWAINEAPEGDGHLGIPNVIKLKDELFEMGVIDENTKLYINHFSHNGNPVQSVLEDKVKGLGIGVSYDGLSVEF